MRDFVLADTAGAKLLGELIFPPRYPGEPVPPVVAVSRAKPPRQFCRETQPQNDRDHKQRFGVSGEDADRADRAQGDARA